MKNYYYFLLSILLINCNTKDEKKPPVISKKEKTFHYFGQEIKDSYYNLENLEDSTVLKWLKAQDNYTKSIIRNNPNRKAIIDKQNQFDNQNTTKTSYLRITSNNFYFYLKREPDENVSKLFYRDGFHGKETLLFNPKDFKPELDEEFSINYIQPNHNGSKIALSFTKNDEEISEIAILDTQTKKLHKEIIDHCWPSDLGGINWLPDNSGFIYIHIPVIDSNSKEYILNTASVLYKLDDDPKKLNILFSKKNNPNLNIVPEDFPNAFIRGKNNNYLFGRLAGARPFDDYYYAENINLTKGEINWKPLFKKEDKIQRFSVKGDNIIFLTAKDAPNFKICKTTLSNPDFQNPKTLVEEDKNAVITDFALTSKGVFYVKTKNGVEAKLYHLDENTGKEEEIQLPKPSGYIKLTSKGYEYEDLWIYTRGWISNTERYRYDFENKVFVEKNLYPVIAYPELEDVVVEEIEIPSHDGVMVPLSIIYKKGAKKDGKNSVLLNGYGAYKSSISPYLYSYLLHWVNEGGIYATAHIRGGGEKGEQWHKGGFKTTKPNSWKDLIACTEYLINQKYTSNQKMALWGASAGGITIGRAITERPDLYAAAIIKVGILNTLRYEFAPNGANNTKEFGTVKDSIECSALYEMDAYQHIQKGVNYPAVYLTGGMKDPRVPVSQPAKFAARLQEANTSKRPILFSVNFEGGHGFDASKNKRNEELADILSFALWQTGHPNYQP